MKLLWTLTNHKNKKRKTKLSNSSVGTNSLNEDRFDSRKPAKIFEDNIIQFLLLYNKKKVVYAYSNYNLKYKKIKLKNWEMTWSQLSNISPTIDQNRHMTTCAWLSSDLALNTKQINFLFIQLLLLYIYILILVFSLILYETFV